MFEKHRVTALENIHHAIEGGPLVQLAIDDVDQVWGKPVGALLRSTCFLDNASDRRFGVVVEHVAELIEGKTNV